MADATCSGANTLFLPDEEIREGIKLLFSAYRKFTSDSDIGNTKYGFGYAHRRVIYFVRRKPELSVTQLISILHITKQSLARIFNQPVLDKSVQQNRGGADQQQRFPSLPEAGGKLEHHLSDRKAHCCGSGERTWTSRTDRKRCQLLRAFGSY